MRSLLLIQNCLYYAVDGRLEERCDVSAAQEIRLIMYRTGEKE